MVANSANQDTFCGIRHFRPDSLQKWATPRAFLVLHSLIGVICGMQYPYRIGVLTTLEKKFTFDSKTSGILVMMVEIFIVLFGPFVGYFGGKTHRPRMLAIGTSIVSISCFLNALPYFIHESSSLNTALSSRESSEMTFCDITKEPESCGSEKVSLISTPMVFFMLASLLMGLGNLPYHSLGISYLDDVAKKENTPLYFGIMMSSRLMGPLLGFLLASACLKINENPFGEDLGYGPEDPRWIGGWWIGYVLQGILILIIGIPTYMFPRRIEGHMVRIQEQDSEKTNFGGHTLGMFRAVKRLAKNPLYYIVILNTLFTIYGTFGHHMMLPKYMENQFRMSASDATLMSGAPAITATMVSILLGGYFMWKVRPTLKVLLALMAILQAINAIGYLLLMIPGCEKIQIFNFGMHNEGLQLYGDCNAHCDCTQTSFTPICGPDDVTVYFSPCFAGCEEKFNKSYSQCSCLSMSSVFHEDAKGYCASESCWSQALVYIIMLPLHQLFANILQAGYPLILLRSIEPEDKSVALGTFEALISLFGFLPFGVIFGALIDTTCLIWEKTCGETGNCWFYDVHSFNNIIHGTSAGFSTISTMTVCAIFLLRGRIKSFYEEEEEGTTEMK